MSMMLMVQAMQTKVGNPLRKLVLLKLADNANDQGECWPSYQYVADQCEISKRSVMTHIEALEKAGLLRKEIRKGGPKGNSSNVYHLCLGAAFPAPGGVQEIHHPSAGAAPGSAGDSLGGSAGAAPRTSHSLEPVKEPVIEPVPAQAADATLPGDGELVVCSSNDPKLEIPEDMPGPKDRSAKTFRTWANYAFAYRKRYGAWPLWNATVAGMISKFIDRVGIDQAPKVAAFYIGVNDAFILKSGHPVKLLLSGAEQYHTQYITGRTMTQTRARQMDQSQANAAVADDAMALYRQMQERRNAQ